MAIGVPTMDLLFLILLVPRWEVVAKADDGTPEHDPPPRLITNLLGKPNGPKETGCYTPKWPMIETK